MPIQIAKNMTKDPIEEKRLGEVFSGLQYQKVPSEQGRLGAIRDQISTMHTRIYEMKASAAGTADRVLGVVGEGPGNPLVRPEALCETDEISGAISEMADDLEALSVHIERFKAL